MRILSSKMAYGALSILGLLIVGFFLWLFRLDSLIQTRIKDGWFESPIDLYAQGEWIYVGQKAHLNELKMRLRSRGLVEVSADETLLPSSFTILDEMSCAEKVDSPFLENTANCLYFREDQADPHLVAFSAEDVDATTKSVQVTLVFSGAPLIEQTEIYLPPSLYAQFYHDQPILRQLVSIGDVPLQCLQAITAVEDSRFLEHDGVSWTGILRATLQNLLKGRVAQGGSTITQQLVKNYFLTSERTLKRKFTELFMALLLEARVSKDQILESYMNVIYMGKNGPFQVIGLKAASDYYFSRPLSRLNLGQCALLAAIINSPGRFNPFTHPENALSRRKKVLARMEEVGFISPTLAQEALSQPLPQSTQTRFSEPAAYYTQAVFRELETLGITKKGGLRIYTSLNERAQELAQKFTLQHVQKLETTYKSLQNHKQAGKDLEAAMISVDVTTGSILSIVGGRHYSKTQFNRILDGHRQVGSIMKPFVFLAALEKKPNAKGQAYNPLTPLLDEKFTHQYEGQRWSPDNYDHKTRGEVPFYYALKNSLNIPTARLGIDIGLDNIVDVARRAGVVSEIKPFPSLTLGAFEIRPIEMAQAYQSIANFGLKRKLHTVQKIVNYEGQVIYEYAEEPDLVFAPTKAGVLVSMLEQTVKSGTAKRIRLSGFAKPAAGKTGTTSDTKDAWFAGFTPKTLTLTWTGYDDNTPSGLTGASGALPLWLNYMQAFESESPKSEFRWPEGLDTERIELFTTPEEETTNSNFNADSNDKNIDLRFESD